MRRPAVLLALAVLGGACDAPAAEGGIERDAFIATYVDLRRATVDGRLDAGTRDSILGAHGTTEEELRAYVTARADDPEAIADTWREINEILTAPTDTVSADAIEGDTIGMPDGS